MDVTVRLDAACSCEVLFAWIEDLATYPHWLDIVSRAVPTDAGPAAGEVCAWHVDLRGRFGPLARSKRLRMQRTVREAPRRVRFERREIDARSHSPWVLDGSVQPADGGARLTMHLHYGGTLWGPLLERLLTDAIERARPRLAELVAEGSPPHR